MPGKAATHLTIFASLLIAVVFTLCETADAMPAFAREYGVSCNVCHAAYPRLNDFGQRFAGEQDRLSARDAGDIRIDPNGTSGWGILGARGIWDVRGGWQFALGIDNVLDKRYRVHGSGLDAPGRNVMVSLRKTW